MASRIADGAVTIHDLGSKNGTRVKGRLIEGAARLEDGDEIRLGSVLLSSAPSRGRFHADGVRASGA